MTSSALDLGRGLGFPVQGPWFKVPAWHQQKTRSRFPTKVKVTAVVGLEGVVLYGLKLTGP